VNVYGEYPDLVTWLPVRASVSQKYYVPLTISSELLKTLGIEHYVGFAGDV
jgi:hypothetical protein